MRLTLVLASLFALAAIGCKGGDQGNDAPGVQCSDHKDNDLDGLVDYPDDPGCTDPQDDSEDSPAMPQCKDGRDNDMDGKTDYPDDPGCFAPQQDEETDDCPNGPTCPQCSNGKDDDNNGQTDYPNDTGGCKAASDTDEYTDNPAACGSNVMIQKLPFDNHVAKTIMTGAPSNLTSGPMCNGAGAGVEDVYQLRINAPKVVVATTDSTLTSADTVLYIRGANCATPASEVTCSDDISATNKKSTVTAALMPGTYYLVVDAKDLTTTGSYDLTVHFYVGEGVECINQDDCGPGLVCRIPLGQTGKVCAKHVCEDTDDEDGDGKVGYPTDPGCDSLKDDDESDPCPGMGCPECADGADNDMDTTTDYPMDTTCTSASSQSEACLSAEGVSSLTMPMTMGTTATGATNEVNPTCDSSTGLAPDRTYRLDVPSLSQLKLNLINTTYDSVTVLYNSTCTGTPIACSDPYTMTVNNVAAGTYYFAVDGYFTTSTGPYTIQVDGRINNGQSCEAPLAQSGALKCNNGYACKGMVGMRTCQPALCSDGIDNDVPADGKVDYPFDPGCDSPADDTEADTCPTMNCPVCSDAMDNDADATTDFPADFGCAGAADTSEVFCAAETDVPAVKITSRNTAGNTLTHANDFLPSCQTFSAAPDLTYGLTLPVPVQTLVMDTNNSFDTVLTFKDVHCAAEILCDDDSGTPGLESMITATNVAAGNYAITVDGYSSNAGAFTLHVLGTVAAGTPCSSPLFSGGANAMLVCPTGTTCTGSPLRCQ